MTYILVILPVICIAILALRFYTHMLQLSSYQFQGYFKFLRSNPARCITHILFAAFILLDFAPLNLPQPVQILFLFAALVIFIALIIPTYIPAYISCLIYSYKICLNIGLNKINNL